MMSEYVIETEGLTKWFGSKPALRDLTLALPRGGVHALIGSNGAGKSTLFRILLGLMSPTSGASRILGHESPSLSAEARGRIGLVHEEHTLPGWMGVSELTAMQRALYPRWSEDTFQAVIGHYQITPAQRVRDLSRGERAGLNLALALAQRPELLILDEPTLGLDVVAKQAFLESLMFSGQDEGCTIVYCSHQMDEVERLADTLIILSRGRLMAMDTPDAFCSRVSQWSTDLGADVPIEAHIPGLLQRQVIEGAQHLLVLDADPQTPDVLRRLGATYLNQMPLGLDRAVGAFLAQDHARPTEGRHA